MQQLTLRSVARGILLLALPSPVFMLMGCGDSKEGPPTAQVTGTATVNGSPLAKEGLSLVFEPADDGSAEEDAPMTPPATLAVQPDGTFSGEVAIGKHKVYLMVTGGGIDHYNPNAAKEAFGVNPLYLQNPDVENSAARKFHEVTVKAPGPNEYTFEFGK